MHRTTPIAWTLKRQAALLALVCGLAVPTTEATAAPHPESGIVVNSGIVQNGRRAESGIIVSRAGTRHQPTSGVIAQRRA